MRSPRQGDQLEVEDREQQEILDTGQQQQPVMQVQFERNSMSVEVNPEFLLSVPFADDSDAEDLEDAEETQIFPADRPSSLHFTGEPSLLSSKATRQAPLYVPSPQSSLQYGQLPANSPSLAPHPNDRPNSPSNDLPNGPPNGLPNGLPNAQPNGLSNGPPDGLPNGLAPPSAPYPLEVTVPTPGNDDHVDDDVFVADPSKRNMSAAEMFADMTSTKPRLRRLSSDPCKHKIEREDSDPGLPVLRLTHSLPLEKTYSCIKEYKQAERKEVNRIINEHELDISPHGSEASIPTEKPQTKEKKRNESIKKRLSFSTKKSKDKKKKPQAKRRSGIDSLLCASGNHEDRADAMPYYGEEDRSHKHTEHETLTNSPPHLSDQEELDRILRKGLRRPKVESGSIRESGTEEAGSSSSKWTVLKNTITRAIHRPKTLHKHCLLLLKAPVCKKKFDYVRDEKSRKKQYEAFCKLYPGLVDHSVQTTEETVNTFEDIEKYIRKFFKKGASRAVMAVIIFNGHGSSKGLKLSKENEPLPLDTFIKKVTELLEEHRENHECQLPHLLKIVFAQCHGHEYTVPQQHGIDIISLTTPNKPTTQSHIKLDPLTLDVEESEHGQLTSYASRTSLTEETLGQIRKRKPSGALDPIRQREPLRSVTVGS